jgi:carboxyl-terminal processing protease
VKFFLLFLVILLVPVIPTRAAPFSASGMLDQDLVAEVTGTALAFMGPRALEPVTIPQMAVWGLGGLAAFDPRFAITLQGEGKDATLRLTLAGGRDLLVLRPAPPPQDAAAWGNAVGAAIRAAWDVSEPMRRAGRSAAIGGFFDALFGHLDPYSRYMPAEQAEAERLRRTGRAGVGLDVAVRGGALIVTEAAAGGPAAEAGIRPGDRLLAVDGESVRGADAASVSERLAGPEQTLVEITLRSPDGRSRTLSLERAPVPAETVTASRQGAMLVLRISGFSRNTGARLAQELIRGLADPAPPHGLVIDLRDNRGGVLQQAVDATALLQERGLIAITTGRAPEAAHVFTASGHDLARSRPVVVLVDGGTASAAEIMAAALADQRRAVVVGSVTLGKGLVQAVETLPDGGELFLTWSRVLAPFGWPIQDLGVLPQVCTSLGRAALDRQLAALAVGRQPMAAALDRVRAARAPLSPASVQDLRGPCPPAGRQDADFDAARFLIDDPQAYATALFPRAAGDTVPPNLTPPAAVRN